MKRTIVVTWLLAVILLSSIVHGGSEENVLLLTLSYDAGNVDVRFLTKTAGFFQETISQPQDAYSLRVLSRSNKEMYIEYFDFHLEEVLEASREWFDENGNQIYFPSSDETHLIHESVEHNFIIPYSSDMKFIRVHDPQGHLKLNIDLDEHLMTYDERVERSRDARKPSINYLKLVLMGTLGVMIVGCGVFLGLRKFRG